MNTCNFLRIRSEERTILATLSGTHEWKMVVLSIRTLLAAWFSH